MCLPSIPRNSPFFGSVAHFLLDNNPRAGGAKLSPIQFGLEMSPATYNLKIILTSTSSDVFTRDPFLGPL